MKELIQLSEKDEMVWCPSCDEYKVRKCNQPEEVEKRLISEFVNALYCCIETKTFGEFKNEWVINLGMFKHQVKKWEDMLK